MLTVSQLFIYPIKSLGGIAVPSAMVTDRGFQHDRRWMLVDNNNQFLTQRELPGMSLLQVSFTKEGLQVSHKKNKDQSIDIPFNKFNGNEINVQVWDDNCHAKEIDSKTDQWFSDNLDHSCKLVYMPDNSLRKVDTKYATNNEITSFSDGYPFLIIGQSTLDNLNDKLADPLPVNRFRPNIVFSGGKAFQEDGMEHFKINDINFYGIKLCGRCMITTINQDDSNTSHEPLKTLASYRTKNNKVYFGQNLLHNGSGLVNIGDELKIIKQKEYIF
jgi:uncharacterized protein YcbX